MDAIKHRWDEWKSNNRTEFDIIRACNQKLERCQTILQLMTEVLFEEKNAAVIPKTNDITIPIPQGTSRVQDSPKPKLPDLTPWERLKNVFDAGDDPEAMQTCFDAFLADPDQYTETIKGECHLKGFSFHHCGCSAWGRKTSSNRQDAERIIVEDIDKRKQNKMKTLHIASFGAGGLLEDLIIIGKLIRQKGFKNIKVIFVDPNHAPDNAKKFAEMLNKLPGVTIQAYYPPFVPTRDKFDAIYSTDLNDLRSTARWSIPYRYRRRALSARAW